MRRLVFWRWVAVLLVACASVSCQSSQRIQPTAAPDVDPTLGPSTYIEDGELVTFIVNVLPARYRENDGYMPLEFSVANKGVKRMVIARESFELRDEAGNRYPAAGPAELLENYEYLDLDREPTLAQLGGLISDRYAAYQFYPSSFSPTRADQRFKEGQQVIRDIMTLPRHGFMLDWLYFPTPVTGVKGKKFELFLTSRDLPEPVFVKFIVK
jgi:hypothetical protein